MTIHLDLDLQTVPRLPGVYRFYSSQGDVIYAGKAKSLRNRLGSYFSKSVLAGSKTYAMLEVATRVEFTVTANELEAILLEAELIKLFKPKYNIQLKDDKSYLYIVIRPAIEVVATRSVNFPRLLVTRLTGIIPADEVFGPFTDSKTARYVYKSLRRTLSFRDCSSNKFKAYHKRQQPCLYGQIGLCPAPCVNNGAVSNKEYDLMLKRVRQILSGKSAYLTKSLQKKMRQASEDLNYEEAAVYRNILEKLAYLSQGFKMPHQYIDNPNLTQDLHHQALDSLVSALPNLSQKPARIECYDISHTSGQFTVGSMVVSTDGSLDASEYKKFKIKQPLKSSDDYAAMREVLTRRFTNVSWELPDLVVVDGGTGQVAVAVEVLRQFELDIPCVGLAKKHETIVYFAQAEEQYKEILLPRHNLGVQHLQLLRDEAHRFAQRYHHTLRLKQLKV